MNWWWGSVENNHKLSEAILLQRLICIKQDVTLTESEWELLLCQARSASQVARLAYYVFEKSYFSVPDYIAKHLSSAQVYFESQSRIVCWELNLLALAFQKLQLPLVLLKGGAYAAAKLDASYGRIFSDIDILVPQHRLEEVKNTLIWEGWFPEKLDAYDQQYYHKWMHELPPMRHIDRETTLDIHHNILPQTACSYPDAEKLYANITRIGETNFWMLQAEDMVLHSASHLFLNGEFENGLRDLTDMDLLIRQFSLQIPNFLQRLTIRSRELSLQQPLFFAFYYCKTLLRCPIADEFIQALSTHSVQGIRGRIMDLLLRRALMPDHSSCDDRWTGLARWLLYIRSHWLRMPVYLLVPHLLRKSWLRLTGEAKH